MSHFHLASRKETLLEFVEFPLPDRYRDRDSYRCSC